MSSSKKSSKQSASKKDAKPVANETTDKKVPFWKKVNDGMDGAKKAIDSGKAINENLGNPLKILKDSLFSVFRKSKEEEIKKDNQENVSATLDQKIVKSSDAEKPIEDFDKNEVESVDENSLNDAPDEKNSKKSAFELFEKQLQVCSENPLYSDSVKNLVVAELGMFKILKSPNCLLLQNFSDLVMEHLLLSFENIEDENDKKNFQKNAGLLIRSIVNYLQARIAYLEDDSVGAQDLVDSACSDITSISKFILGILTSNKTKIDIEGLAFTPVAGKVSKISIEPEFDYESIKNACDELKKIKSFGFFARLFLARKKIQQEKEIFYSFLAGLFENLRKYRYVFGCENRILSQLVERYGSIIAEEGVFSEDDVMDGFWKIVEIDPLLMNEYPKYPRRKPFYIPLIVVLFLTIILDSGIIYAIRDTSFFVLLTILTIIISVIIAYFVLQFIDEVYYGEMANNEWREKVNNFYKEVACVYYKGLAKIFYDFDKS